MKLKRRTSYINYSKEGHPQKKFNIKPNLSRYLYFLILIGIAIYFGFVVFNKLLYVEGVGLLKFKPITLRALNDVRIEKMYYQEGDILGKGDTVLVKHFLEDDPIVPDKPDNQALIRENNLRKTARDRNLKEAELNYLERRLEINKKELEKLNELAAMELVLKDRIVKKKQEIEELKLKINKLRDEIDALDDYYNELLNDPIPDANNPNNGLFENCVAPINGEIYQIHKQQGEIALKGEEIMSIASLKEMSIKGYFSQDNLKHLKEDKIVTIEFPGDIESKGVITKFYFSTLPLPEEFQKKYEPTQRRVIVDIKPVHGEEHIWAKLHMLSVKLRIPRFSLFN